jgi:hypothetical protein
VVHVVNGQSRIEYPIGKVLYQTAGWISDLRFSPNGDRLAFIDHNLLGDDGGTISVVDLNGKKSDLTERWASAIGAAWSPSGDEIWFTATASGFSRSLRGVTLSRRARDLLSAPGTLTLHDVGAGGRALISRDALRAVAIGLAPGESKERDLSWQDWTVPIDISEDGKLILFIEAGEAGGGEYAVFSRDTNGKSAVRLGQGSANAFSPDGKWTLVLRQNMSPPDFVLLPTGVGQQRAVPTGNVIPAGGQFLDSKQLVFGGNEPGHASRVYVEGAWMLVNLIPLLPRGFTWDHTHTRFRRMGSELPHLTMTGLPWFRLMAAKCNRSAVHNPATRPSAGLKAETHCWLDVAAKHLVRSGAWISKLAPESHGKQSPHRMRPE